MHVLSNRLLILYAPLEKVQLHAMLHLLLKRINLTNKKIMSQTLLIIVTSTRHFQFNNPVK